MDIRLSSKLYLDLSVIQFNTLKFGGINLLSIPYNSNLDKKITYSSSLWNRISFNANSIIVIY